MVEFKTKFDAQMVEIMKSENYRKTRKVFVWISCLFVALGALFILFAITEWKSNHEEAMGDLGFGAFMIFAGVFYYFFIKFVANKTQKREMESMTLMGSDTEEVYKFDEDKLFIFTNKGDDYRSAIEATYKYIDNIVEADDYYVLYISKIQCHVLQKKDIVSGSIEELNKIFEKHFTGDKYKKLLKKN